MFCTAVRQTKNSLVVVVIRRHYVRVRTMSNRRISRRTVAGLRSVRCVSFKYIYFFISLRINISMYVFFCVLNRSFLCPTNDLCNQRTNIPLPLPLSLGYVPVHIVTGRYRYIPIAYRYSTGRLPVRRQQNLLRSARRQLDFLVRRQDFLFPGRLNSIIV
jgi:hypothetical protein